MGKNMLIMRNKSLTGVDPHFTDEKSNDIIMTDLLNLLLMQSVRTHSDGLAAYNGRSDSTWWHKCSLQFSSHFRENSQYDQVTETKTLLHQIVLPHITSTVYLYSHESQGMDIYLNGRQGSSSSDESEAQSDSISTHESTFQQPHSGQYMLLITYE